MENFNENDRKYLAAKQRVKRMKGFYIHATVYVLVNLFIITQSIQSGEKPDSMNNYWTAIFWGIGLLAHGLSVFGPNIFLGKDWEERKTRELMDKYK